MTLFIGIAIGLTLALTIRLGSLHARLFRSEQELYWARRQAETTWLALNRESQQ